MIKFFNSILNKKKKMSLFNYGQMILQENLKLINSFMDENLKDPDSPFSICNKNALFTELLVLAVWSLFNLGLKKEVLASIVQNLSVASTTKNENSIDEFTNFIVQRSQEYNNLFKDGSESQMMVLMSNVASNIDKDLSLNIFTNMELLELLVQITELNSKLIKYGDENIEIII